MKMHKIGGHVLSEHRNKWGEVAPKMVCCVSLQEGAFIELPEEAIKIYRTQILGNHVDIAGDFDKLADEKLYPAAEWWWSQLKPIYEPVQNKFKNVFFQPINEIDNHRAAEYMRGMMDAAHKDGYKLALFGDAGDSPTWDTWVKYWIPILKQAEEQGHIYCRHAYSGVGTEANYLTSEDGTPTDDNTGRPFKEAQYLIDHGISVPILIGELGWHGGYRRPGYHFLEDLTRYNALMMKYDNIIGGALWTWGNWPTKEESNLGGEKTADLARWMAQYQPKFYDFSFKAKAKETTKEKVLAGESGQTDNQSGQTGGRADGAAGQVFQEPKNLSQRSPALTIAAGSGGIADHLRALIFQLSALRLHSPTILSLAMSADGVIPLSQELRLNYGGTTYLVQLAHTAGGAEWRAYYSPVGDPQNISVVSTGQLAAAPAPITHSITHRQIDTKKKEPEDTDRFIDQEIEDSQKSLEVDGSGATYEQETNFDKVDELAGADELEEIDLTEDKGEALRLLKLVFYSQHWKNAKYKGDCGPTCTSMVLDAVKNLKKTPAELMEFLGKTSNIAKDNYTTFVHLERILNHYGVYGTYKGNATVQDIENALDKGHPVIALLDYGKIEADARYNPNGFAGWHYVVLMGYDKSHFYFFDPLQFKEKRSKSAKKTFHAAMEGKGYLNTPYQIFIVQSKGIKGEPAWKGNLPEGIEFIPALGDRAAAMSKPTGELEKAWVFTGFAGNPRLIRKGKLVEVKSKHVTARLGPSKTTTDLKKVTPGQTMILTNRYHNGYTQVELELGEDMERPGVEDGASAGVVSGQGTRIDLKDYFFAEPGKQIMVKHPDGNSEKFLTKDLGGGWYVMQKNHKWELWKVDDQFIYLVDDVSPADDSGGTKRFYRVRKGMDSEKLTPYCKRHMRVGETYRDGGHQVQFYRVSNGHKLNENSGGAENKFQFLGKGDAIQTLNGQDTLDDVIHVKGGTEEHWFARGLGRIAWTSKWGQSKIEEIIKNHQEPPPLYIPTGYKPPAGVNIEGKKIGNEGF